MEDRLVSRTAHRNAMNWSRDAIGMELVLGNIRPCQPSTALISMQQRVCSSPLRHASAKPVHASMSLTRVSPSTRTPPGEARPLCRGSHRRTAERQRASAGEAGESSPSSSPVPPSLTANDASASSSSAPQWVTEAVNLFPLWVTLACVLALIRPQLFQWVQGKLIVFALALTMLGMGFTLSLDELGAAFSMPRELAAGVALQYTVMPTLGFLISRLPFLPSSFAVGLILVSCCPGGTASNIVTYLARGNVALSVIMTAASTMLAVVMTPLLTSVLAGQLVPVDGRALFISTLQVVLLPVVSGSLLSKAFPRTIAALGPYSALFAVLTVALIVGSGISSSAAPLIHTSTFTPQLFLSLVLSVFLLHSTGFLLGYVIPRKLLGLPESESRTISIEVGMQNSILGVVLATRHFSSPLVAAPAAVSAVTHSVLGSLLASVWRRIKQASDGLD